MAKKVMDVSDCVVFVEKGENKVILVKDQIQYAISGAPEFMNGTLVQVPAYKEFALQKMIRADGIVFYYDLKNQSLQAAQCLLH